MRPWNRAVEIKSEKGFGVNEKRDRKSYERGKREIKSDLGLWSSKGLNGGMEGWRDVRKRKVKEH